MTIKRIYALILFICTLGMFTFYTDISMSVNAIEYNNFRYEVNNANVIITGYVNEPVEIVIPDKINDYPVVGISALSFANCKSLESVILPESLSYIEDSAFMNCDNLKFINLPNKLKSIEHNTFNDCKSLEQIKIPDSVTNIGMDAFKGCTNLSSITFPRNMKTIGACAFDETEWLHQQNNGLICAGNVIYSYKGEMPENTTLTINDAITAIAECAFKDQINLKGLTFGGKITRIGKEAFSNTGLESIELTDLTKIEYGTFSNCKSLKNIKIPETVKSIESHAFEGCESLDNVIMYDGIKFIGSDAFTNCCSLKSITIPLSVKGIQEHGLGYRYSNETQQGEDLLEPIKDFIIYGYTGTVAETYALKNEFTFISLGESPTDVISGFVVQNEWEYELKDDVMTWTFLRDDSDIVMTIEDGVCNVDGDIMSNIFYWWPPDNSDNFVFDWLFENPIQEINFSDNVTEIDTMWFSTGYFREAKKISFGNNIKSIGSKAFWYSEVKSIILPESLQQIGYNAFRWCYNLNDVTVLSKNVALDISGIGYGNAEERLRYMTIQGYKNSTTEKYANQHGFTFISLDEPTIKGDANGDGKLTASDAAFIAKTLAEAAINNEQIEAKDYPVMDFNQDCKITAKDAADIARYLAEQAIK